MPTRIMLRSGSSTASTPCPGANISLVFTKSRRAASAFDSASWTGSYRIGICPACSRSAARSASDPLAAFAGAFFFAVVFAAAITRRPR
jgi:hypothetical protein